MVITKNLSLHVQGLKVFLERADEKANEDLAIQYFRKIYPSFTRQEDAVGADGYVKGHFVLELKDKETNWFSGLLQGLAYKNKSLDFTCVVVATHSFLAIWRISDIPEYILEDIKKSRNAPNVIGKQLASKYKKEKEAILKKAIWKEDSFIGLFTQDTEEFKLKIQAFEKTLKEQKVVRQRITLKNFTKILSQMVSFFDKPIKAVRAFYSMLYGWDESSILEISQKTNDIATLHGEIIKNLIPSKRLAFKSFIESYCISEDVQIDEFFANYDKALDCADKEFRVKHGIYFTDLDLARFALWFVKQNIPNLGKDYLVIDPACGSGNLVTSWRSPLELRHKVVSEIEPELLFAVENRMKGDAWHNGKYTVVPSVKEGKGLNFLDISAMEYLKILKEYLKEKGLKPNKPIAFLCNPPYRGDDDQTAGGIGYKIHPSIIDVIGEDASAERYNCFLAQMKLICDNAESNGLPDNSLLLLFTKTGWLTDRPSFQNLKNSLFSSFEYLDGFIVNGREFFDLDGKFPIAFTIWSYQGKIAKLNPERPVLLRDLTWVNKKDLSQFHWDNLDYLDKEGNAVLTDLRTIRVPFGIKRSLMKNYLDTKRQDFIRSKRKKELQDPIIGGLPLGDKRRDKKSAYGEVDGKFIGFMDNLTPCRISKSILNVPWFRLNSQFMDCKRTRCFSGPADNRSFSASDHSSAQKTFLWFALCRTFVQFDYPMWADALEIWEPKIPESLAELTTKITYAIGFAENECVETIFPTNNPVKEVIELFVNNPMAPTNTNSFWSKIMFPIFGNKDNSLADQLVSAVEEIYKEWEKYFKQKNEINAPYSKPYFIGEGKLRKTAGLIQIRHYAEAVKDEKLIELDEKRKKLLKEVKQEFYNLLLDPKSINYFGLPEEYTKKVLAKEDYKSKEMDNHYSKRQTSNTSRQQKNSLIIPNLPRTNSKHKSIRPDNFI